MKRSSPPKRRTPLRAKPRARAISRAPDAENPQATARRPGEIARDRAQTPPRRKRIKARSDKREAARDAERDVRLAVFARDGHRCVLEGRDGWGPCAGPLQFGHLRKASQRGRYEEANGVTQCARHNGLIEDRPTEAHALGLVVRAGETVDAAWDRMRAAGLVGGGAPPGETGRPPLAT